MAQKFGGKYSPEATGALAEAARAAQTQPETAQNNPFRGKQRSRAGGRVNLLFIAPLPLAIRAFFQDPTGLALYLTAFALLLLAAWLTREGVIAQEAFDARRVARKPAIPRKIFGSVLTGIALFLAGFVGNDSLIDPLIFAVLGTGLHSFAFGLDPLNNKGLEGTDLRQSDRVTRAVEQAEAHLTTMTSAIARTSDRQLHARVERFQTTARDMFRTVQDDPRDLNAARKYLGVYLKGASAATVKFADLYSRTTDPASKADYLLLLDDLEANFTQRTKKLLLDDRSDLNVEIDVLRDRLKREGLRDTK